jgi:actin-related protein
VLSGGTSRLSGLSSRVQSELSRVASSFGCSSQHVKVWSNENLKPDAEFQTWKGGAFFCDLYRDSLKDRLISREEYDEYGLPILQRRCF